MLRSLRRIVGSMMATVVVLTVVPIVVPPADQGTTYQPGLVMIGLVVLAIVLAVVIEAVGYRSLAMVRTIGARQVFQNGTMLRAAVSESVAFIALALSFLVASDGVLVYLVGAGLSLGLLGFHAYPWRRPIDKTEEELRRADGPSDLREQLGLSTGPIREL